MSVLDVYRNLFGRKSLNDGDIISLAEHGRAGGLSSGQPFKFTDFINYSIKITESGSYTYVAYANPGTAESAAAWKVMRMDDSTGIRILWADGYLEFDNIATDLTALSYS